MEEALQRTTPGTVEAPPTDHLDEIWAQELPGLPIDGGDVWGKIEDMQGRFNVNNLIDDAGEIDEDMLEQFRRLLDLVIFYCRL